MAVIWRMPASVQRLQNAIARRILDYWLVGNYPSEADIAAIVRQGKAGRTDRHAAPCGRYLGAVRRRKQHLIN